MPIRYRKKKRQKILSPLKNKSFLSNLEAPINWCFLSNYCKYKYPTMKKKKETSKKRKLRKLNPNNILWVSI